MSKYPDTALSEPQRRYLQSFLKKTIEADLPGSERIIELINGMLANGLQGNAASPSVADPAPVSNQLSLQERTYLESWLQMLEHAEPRPIEDASQLATLIRELLDGKRTLKRPNS